MPLRPLARGDTKHPGTLSSDNNLNLDPAWMTFQVLNEEGFLVDPQRQLIHPSFNAVEGEGIFTYDYNPDLTRNFILSPAPQVESMIQRTLLGSIVVQHLQNLEDVIIEEVWTGGNKLSVLAEMFRRFYQFWTTIPSPGRFVTWHPADLSVESYGVVITNVELGSPGQITYREYQQTFGSRQGAFLAETLTVQMKIITDAVAPLGVITLEGL